MKIEPGGSPSYPDSGSSKASKADIQTKSAMKADPHYSKPKKDEQRDWNENNGIFVYRKSDQEDQEEPETPQGWGNQFQDPPQEINIERFSVPRDSYNEDIDLGNILSGNILSLIFQ